MFPIVLTAIVRGDFNALCSLIAAFRPHYMPNRLKVVKGRPDACPKRSVKPHVLRVKVTGPTWARPHFETRVIAPYIADGAAAIIARDRVNPCLRLLARSIGMTTLRGRH